VFKLSKGAQNAGAPAPAKNAKVAAAN